jgi:hypothetical protein
MVIETFFVIILVLEGNIARTYVYHNIFNGIFSLSPFLFQFVSLIDNTRRPKCLEFKECFEGASLN